MQKSQYSCVEIQEFGGSSDFVGTFDVAFDDESDYVDTIYCDSGQIITYQQVYSSEDVVTLNNDGTLTIEYDYVDSIVDYDQSRMACELIWEVEEGSETIEGFWAYDSDTEIFSLILTEEEEDDEDDTYVVQFLLDELSSDGFYLISDETEAEDDDNLRFIRQ